MRLTAIHGVLLLGALLLGCAENPQAPSVQGRTAELRVQLVASQLGAAVGDTIAVGVAAESQPGKPLIGLQGRLRFDPRRLRYLGQRVTPYLVMVNARETQQGNLRFLCLTLDGLEPVAGDLRFQVLAPDYAEGLQYAFEEGVYQNLAVAHSARVIEPMLVRSFARSSNTSIRSLTAQDWVALLEPTTPKIDSRPQLLPGAGLVYGDANLSGTVTNADAVATANVAVGNLDLLIPANRDYAIAANVAPANLPGLGEFDDPLPPGRNADGSYTITIADAATISNKAVGNSVPIAGELVPGRMVTPNRVIISDSIKLNRTFYRDTVYELHGTVVVGNPEVEDVTLTIQAGTRIEGDAASRGALVIRRGANLIAVGTRLQPIVFTCNAALKMPGCWGGLAINGFSLLNNGDPVDGGVIPVKVGKGGTGYYGGPLVQDSSGVLRYVRIEYAGKPTFQGDTLAALSLLGVGAATPIDNVQIFAAGSDGIFVSGGTARLRYTLISDAAGDALHWDDGWQGKGQFLIIHQEGISGHSLHGSNFFLQPNALPRSNPLLSHLTVVGSPSPYFGARTGIRYENGSAGTILNSIFLQSADIGLDIQGDASCSQASDSLNVAASIFYGYPTMFATDADCIDEAAFATDPVRANRIIDPELNAPLNTLSPDYRPISGGAAVTGYVQPPSDFFFDLSAQYLGAVEPMAFITGANIPWYAGWTVGW